MRIAALTSLALGLCAGLPASGAEPAGRNAVVLITMDTLRADHLGAYGYPRPTSPFLDRLSAGGIRFDRAISAMATTVPAHSALFTSRYPTQLGVRKNADVLAESAVTLAEQLSESGFVTAAFVATSVHFGPGNLDQGFAVFDEPQGRGIRSAGEVVDAAIAWLQGVEKLAGVFLWVHVFDPHDPRRPPAAYLEAARFPDADALAAHRSFLRATHRVDPEASLIHLEQRTARAVKIEGELLAYDAAIRYMDDQLARLHAAVEARRGDAEVLWVATADHGEGLGNHGWLGHGKFVYNEQVRVPLILHFSSGAFAGTVSDAVVEHVDVWPTLLDHLGLALPQGTTLMGRSLRPFYAGGPAGAGAGGHAFSERREFLTDPRVKHPQLPLEVLNYEPGETYSLQTRRWKYILHTAGEDELYDLVADPYEAVNAIAREPERAAKLRARLEARIEAYRSETGSRGRVDPETAAKLRALGYVE